jgi:hypothetical protein
MLYTFENVLLELDGYGRLEHGSQWMAEVTAGVANLEASYKKLGEQGRDAIDYSPLPTQAGYLFAYGMPRAYFTHEFLKRHRAALGRPLFARNSISVVSFGGGPASEIVGLLNYLNDANMGEPVTSVAYRVYDKDVDWQGTAEKIVGKIASDISLKMVYDQLDLADNTATGKVNVSDADLIVFSYIMSELCALATKDTVASNVNKILGTMSSGAAMLFVESKQTEFIRYFKDCKGYNGKQINENADGVNITLPEFPSTFRNYAAELDRRPRMSSEKIISKWYVKS